MSEREGGRERREKIATIGLLCRKGAHMALLSFKIHFFS